MNVHSLEFLNVREAISRSQCQMVNEAQLRGRKPLAFLVLRLLARGVGNQALAPEFVVAADLVACHCPPCWCRNAPAFWRWPAPGSPAPVSSSWLQMNWPGRRTFSWNDCKVCSQPWPLHLMQKFANCNNCSISNLEKEELFSYVLSVVFKNGNEFLDIVDLSIIYWFIYNFELWKRTKAYMSKA